MCKSKEEKSLSKDEKREALEQMLQTNFPAKAMTVLATFGTIIAVATIALQIVGMARKVKYWYIAAGIWVGAFVLFKEIVTFALIKTRQVKIYKVLQLMRPLTLLFTTALVVITSIATRNNNEGDEGYDYRWILNVLISLASVMKVTNLIGALLMLFYAKRQYKIYARSKPQHTQFQYV